MALIKNLTLGAIVGVLMSASVFAGTKTVNKNVVEPLTKSAITGDIGVQLSSEYILHGMPMLNRGVIVQPYIDLYFALYEGQGVIDKVSLNLGIASTLSSFRRQSDENYGSRNNWTEFDYSVGVAVQFLKNWTATLSYIGATGPNDIYFYPELSQNLQLTLAYNDSDLLGAWALNPHVTYLRELSGKYGNAYWNDNSATKRGNYFEVGIAPKLPVAGPVTFTLPVNVGFGSGGYYAYYNHSKGNYGFVSAGVNASVPLSFIPSQFGSWSANAGVTYYRLSHAAVDGQWRDTFNQNRWVWSGGIGASF